MSRSKLSEAEQAKRLPPPPGELVGMMQDTIHVESSRLIARKKIRIPNVPQ